MLVSVSCITYNHAPYIRKCLDGFLMQKTNFEFEIIIHDDASTDGTADIIREYEKKYADIIFPIYQKENQWSKGKKPNWDFNAPRWRGKYIAICEGDDYWTDPLKLQKQVDFLENNERCFMITHAMPCLGKSKEGWYNFEQLSKIVYLPHASNYMFRRFDLKKYYAAFLEMLGGETCLLYIAAIEGEIYHSSEVVSKYRITGTGIYTSLSDIEKIEGEIIQLKVIKKHFNIDSKIYRNRMQGLLKRKISITTGNSMTLSKIISTKIKLFLSKTPFLGSMVFNKNKVIKYKKRLEN